jgi:pimeloyl-ACP methyl ester carboxylesterase
MSALMWSSWQAAPVIASELSPRGRRRTIELRSLTVVRRRRQGRNWTTATSAGRMAYSDTGTGPILVLLHATLHDRHVYDPVLAVLAASHRVLAVDWLGHGESDAFKGGRQVTAPLLADLLEEVVLEQDLRDLRLFGNSVGGFAAARLAIRHPDRVAGLVLVDNGGFGATTPIIRTVCRILGTPAITKRVMPRFVNSYMQPRTASDYAIVERAVARARTPAGTALAASMWRRFATPEYDLRDQADRLTAPTRILWGKKDRAIPQSVGRATQKWLPQSKLEIIDTGHVVFSSEPEAFLRIIEPFLASLPVDPSTRSIEHR